MKEKILHRPISPAKEHKEKGKEVPLIKGDEPGSLFYDPETGKVYHNKGNNFKEPQPEWEPKKVKVK